MEYILLTCKYIPRAWRLTLSSFQALGIYLHVSKITVAKYEACHHVNKTESDYKTMCVWSEHKVILLMNS